MDDASAPHPRGYRIGSALVLLLAIAAVGCFAWLGLQPQASQHAPPPAPHVEVVTSVLRTRAITITRLGLGTVTAWNTATITPQVSGQIIELPLHEGGMVKAGDVLVRLDPRPFEAALNQAKARESQDQANLVAAQKNLNRDQALLGRGFSPQQTVDNERAQEEALTAAVAGDAAAVEVAQLNLEYASVRAPFSGVVGLRNVDLGNVVSPTTNIVTLAQIEPIAVDFTLPQADLAAVTQALQSGPPAVTAIDQDGTNILAEGTLEVLNNQVDTATGTIKLKARFPNTDHKLWPGAFVQIRLAVRSEADAIAIPSSALQRGPNGVYVWVVDGSNARIRPVSIEAIEGDLAVIGSGLAAGERIVTAGQNRLADGTPVVESARDQDAKAD